MSEGASIDELLTTGQTRLRAHMLNLAELIFQRVLAKEPENLTALRLLG
nr:hypothetical protein JKL49_20045 [Phenylobacterium glaciei]